MTETPATSTAVDLLSDDTLTATESSTLRKHETTIERAVEVFYAVGAALREIRDQKLYRATHDTFEDYCRDRWGFTDSRARQLIGAAQTVTVVTLSGLPAPSNEGQARALGKVPEPIRAEVWAETIERTDNKPTAAAVSATYDERRQQTTTKPAILAPRTARARKPVPVKLPLQLGGYADAIDAIVSDVSGAGIPEAEAAEVLQGLERLSRSMSHLRKAIKQDAAKLRATLTAETADAE